MSGRRLIADVIAAHAPRGPLALASGLEPLLARPFDHKLRPDLLAASLDALGLDASEASSFAAALSDDALLTLVARLVPPASDVVAREACRRPVLRTRALDMLAISAARRAVPSDLLADVVAVAAGRHGGVLTSLADLAVVAARLDPSLRAHVASQVADPVGHDVLAGGGPALALLVEQEFLRSFSEVPRSEVERQPPGSDVAATLASSPEPLPETGRRVLAAFSGPHRQSVAPLLDRFAALRTPA